MTEIPLQELTAAAGLSNAPTALGFAVAGRYRGAFITSIIVVDDVSFAVGYKPMSI